MEAKIDNFGFAEMLRLIAQRINAVNEVEVVTNFFHQPRVLPPLSARLQRKNKVASLYFGEKVFHRSKVFLRRREGSGRRWLSLPFFDELAFRRYFNEVLCPALAECRALVLGQVVDGLPWLVRDVANPVFDDFVA